MASEEKAAEPDGEPASIARALKGIFAGDWWILIAYVFVMLLFQTGIWGIFLIAKRSASSLDTSVFITMIGAFVLTPWAMYNVVSQARKHVANNIYWLAVSFGVLNALSLITAVFATLYWRIGTTANFSVELSRIDAIYFVLGTLTTAGTGNIYAASQFARGLVGVQMVLDLLFVASAVSLVVTRWSERPSPTDSPD